MAQDGSPVELYLAVPGGPEAERIRRAIPLGADILELGCGVARVSRHLAAWGHAVTGVDSSAAMVGHAAAHIEAIQADTALLDLAPRRWAVVLLPSHLINDSAGSAFLASAARHLRTDGCVLVERHRPGWVDSVLPSTRKSHGVVTEIRDVDRPRRGTVSATVAYLVGGHRYEQPFTAHEVDDVRLAEMAASVRLLIEAVVSRDRTWVRLVNTAG